MKKINLNNQILAEIDDEIYLLKKRIQIKFNLSWQKARDYVNESIVMFYCLEKDKNRKRIKK